MNNGTSRLWAEAENMPMVIGIHCREAVITVRPQVLRLLRSLAAVRFTMVHPEEPYTALLLIYDCKTACATIADLPPVRFLHVRSAHKAEVLHAL